VFAVKKSVVFQISKGMMMSSNSSGVIVNDELLDTLIQGKRHDRILPNKCRLIDEMSWLKKSSV